MSFSHLGFLYVFTVAYILVSCSHFCNYNSEHILMGCHSLLSSNARTTYNLMHINHNKRLIKVKDLKEYSSMMNDRFLLAMTLFVLGFGEIFNYNRSQQNLLNSFLIALNVMIIICGTTKNLFQLSYLFSFIQLLRNMYHI